MFVEGVELRHTECMAMPLQKISTASKSYFDEERRVKKRIYDSLTKLGKLNAVVDVGCGESTRAILSSVESGFVMCIDVEPKRIDVDSRERLDVVQADARYLPLRSDCCDAITFIFTLHEINPQAHRTVLSEARRVAKYVVIADPSPHGVELYEKFRRIYSEAMRSIGRFEEYRDKEYWDALMRSAGLRIAFEEVIEWRAAVPREVLSNIIKNIVEEWKCLGVDRGYIEELKSILYSDKEFRWSSISLLIGINDTAKSSTKIDESREKPSIEQGVTV